MALKQYKPLTPGQRGRISLNLSHLQNPRDLRAWKQIKKNLHRGKRQKAGRNHRGQITAWHRGGGHKRSYRKILFHRGALSIFLEKVGTPQNQSLKAKVEALTYDPNRSADLALLSLPLRGPEGEPLNPRLSREIKEKAGLLLKRGYLWFYILAPQNLQIGDLIPLNYQPSLEREALPVTGESLPVETVPVGSLVHNVEIQKGRGGQIARAAGTYGQVIEKSQKRKQVRLRMPSGEERWIYFGSYVTLGTVGNAERRHVVLAKAGRSRWLSRRPKVRGVAMNPVDHPHGGGEGRTSGGRPSVTPWGWPTRNFRRSKQKKNPFTVEGLGKMKKR